MTQFFIHRPVFAWVLAITVMIVGAFGLQSLAISQYPEVAPTSVNISATYAGASGEIVANSVTSVIEDGMTNLDGLLYMTSTSSEGSSSISLTFDSAVDPDIAQVQVQNKLQLVEGSLPAAVISTGISVTRSSSSILLVGGLVSTDGKYSDVALGNLFSDKMQKQLERLEGVGDVNLFGSEYAMRVWLDASKLYQYSLTPSDVTSAISSQNTNVTVGSLGATPSVEGQQTKILLKTRSQLTSVSDFESIVLTTNDDGSSVFLSDVARIELDNDSYDITSIYNNYNAVGFGVNLSTGANAVETSERVHSTISQLSAGLPQGVEIVYSYDTTPFIEKSITQIFHTLIEAIALVFIVILVFLQSWRATLIPTIVVPIVLLGTFAILEAAGLTLNTLTMFALVLAIGLLVDDAIVVVENVERIMEEEKLSALAATEKSMKEISSALIGIVIVLSSVFLPMSFMSGSTGTIYRQFSVTIISAMVLSLFVALILTPAMCATLLKPSHGKRKNVAARGFNKVFDRLNLNYTGSVTRFLKRPFRMLLSVALISVACNYLYQQLPSSFVPTEDQSILMVTVSLPENATRAQTTKTATAIKDYLLNEQGDYVEGVFSPIGYSFDGKGQNKAMAFVKLKDISERPGKSAAQIAAEANGQFGSGRYGQVLFLLPPAIQGLGTSNGFQMYLIDRGNNGIEALQQQAQKLAADAQQSGLVTAVRGFDTNTATQLTMDINAQQAQAFGLSLSDINNNLSIIFGGEYVNDFILDGKLRNVRVKGDQEYRMQPVDINDWYMRNSNNEMVPMAAFSQQVWGETITTLYHHNGETAISLEGSAAPGATSGEAMDEMARLVDNLGSDYDYAWAGLSYQEQIAGDQEMILYLLSAVVVFLALAALYESWSVPLAVILAVPISVLGALLATWIFGQSNDVYFKVGMLTTIGLAARNAILIIEFAESMRQQGIDIVEAIITAAKMRLRPILMTTFAFAFGVLPLATADGTGANAQNSIGTGMLGGIVFSAIFGILMVPVLYLAIMKIEKYRQKGNSKMMKLLKMAPFILLTGCAAVGPDWEAPTAELENTFVSGESSSINDVAYQAWWREFTDPTLTALVEKGFEQNLSILQAKERIREANALLRETGINSALDGSLSYNRLRSGGENVSTSTSSSASLDAEFVIDLFGGIRREQEAAQSYLAATQADIGTERLAWLAELIEKYADARYYQKAAQLTAATINTRKDTLAITQKQLDNGLSTQYELAEIKASLQTAQADLPGYQAQYQAAIFALATLMDEPAKQILAMMSSSTDQLTLPTTIATGIPADLLRNRPDIRYYEAVLHQQVAKTGVEESDLYPSIRLTGSVSHANSADGWSFGPSISLGLFNRGLLKAQRDAQISAANQAEIDWRSSVLDAVEDVQVAQSNFTLYMQQSDLLKQAAESYSTALELGHNNFKNGAMTLLDLLDTVRSEASTQISAASARNTALQEWAALQIAIGAGAGFADFDQEQANKSPLGS